MSLPPSLLYLVIYNPTLKPPIEHDGDEDEDAEEQAHILFYTAKQRAVSRDKMLRQVGLAKALVNFSSFFNGSSSSDAVYSQTCRMITISPEPDYWIHACVELGKDARPVKANDSRAKGKGSKQQSTVMYDYQDGSVHDSALRIQLLRGYDAFKISHGSFASVYSTRGKEALELQLERFFTVWAWSWDLEGQTNFREYFGTPVHPLSKEIIPLIRVFDADGPAGFAAIVLSPPYIAASKLNHLPYPPSVLPHLLSLAHTRIPSLSRKGTRSNLESKTTSTVQTTKTEKTANFNNTSTGLLAIPSMSMSKMDVRKWSWPGYLTFGNGGANSDNTKESPPAESKMIDSQGGSTTGPEVQDKIISPPTLEDGLFTKPKEAVVDPQLLQDSLNTDIALPALAEGVHVLVTQSDQPPQVLETTGDSTPPQTVDSTHPSSTTYIDQGKTDLEPEVRTSFPQTNGAENKTGQTCRSDIPPRPSPLAFLETLVDFNFPGCVSTRRRKVNYVKHEGLLLALIPLIEGKQEVEADLSEAELYDIQPKAVELLQSIREVIDDGGRIAEAFSTPSVRNVLQKSQSFISTPSQLTYGTSSFSSSSGHLHETHQILHSSPDINEVFSRSQNPQDWYIAKRLSGGDESKTGHEPSSHAQGRVYMEIGRKEASLADVDNELSGVIRRFQDS